MAGTSAIGIANSSTTAREAGVQIDGDDAGRSAGRRLLRNFADRPGWLVHLQSAACPRDSCQTWPPPPTQQWTGKFNPSRTDHRRLSDSSMKRHCNTNGIFVAALAVAATCGSGCIDRSRRRLAARPRRCLRHRRRAKLSCRMHLTLLVDVLGRQRCRLRCDGRHRRRRDLRRRQRRHVSRRAPGRSAQAFGRRNLPTAASALARPSKKDRLYVGDMNGVVRCLATADGKEIWNKELEGEVYAGPTLHRRRCARSHAKPARSACRNKQRRRRSVGSFTSRRRCAARRRSPPAACCSPAATACCT